jgi:hypothetical protein
MGTAQAEARRQAQRPADLFDKCRRFTAAARRCQRGVYPYFQPIEESYDTEVVIRGERKIMVGLQQLPGV